MKLEQFLSALFWLEITCVGVPTYRSSFVFNLLDIFHFVPLGYKNTPLSMYDILYWQVIISSNVLSCMYYIAFTLNSLLIGDVRLSACHVLNMEWAFKIILKILLSCHWVIELLGMEFLLQCYHVIFDGSFFMLLELRSGHVICLWKSLQHWPQLLNQ